MIYRFFAAVRRVMRELTIKNEFSAQWHRDQERASWQSDFEGGTWKAHKLDHETWKPGR